MPYIQNDLDKLAAEMRALERPPNMRGPGVQFNTAPQLKNPSIGNEAYPCIDPSLIDPRLDELDALDASSNLWHYLKSTRQMQENGTLDDHRKYVSPRLIWSDTSSTASSEWSQPSHSQPQTPSPTLEPFEEDHARDMRYEESNALPPVAGPSSLRAELSPEPDELSDDEDTAETDNSLDVKSTFTHACPFARNGKPCTHTLVHNERLIREHLKIHRDAGELPMSWIRCPLCSEQQRAAAANGRRGGKVPGTVKTTLQKFAGHIHGKHFPEVPFPCKHCGHIFGGEYGRNRHQKKCLERLDKKRCRAEKKLAEKVKREAKKGLRRLNKRRRG